MKCFGKQVFCFFVLLVNSMCLLSLDPAVKILAMSAFAQAFMCPWLVLLN